MRLQSTFRSVRTVAITALCLLGLGVGTCSAQSYGGRYPSGVGVQLRFNGGGISIGGGGIGINLGGGYYGPSYYRPNYYQPNYFQPNYYGPSFGPSYLPPSYYNRPQYPRYNVPQYPRYNVPQYPRHPGYPGNRSPYQPPIHQQHPTHGQPHNQHHHR